MLECDVFYTTMIVVWTRVHSRLSCEHVCRLHELHAGARSTRASRGQLLCTEDHQGEQTPLSCIVLSLSLYISLLCILPLCRTLLWKPAFCSQKSISRISWDMFIVNKRIISWNIWKLSNLQCFGIRDIVHFKNELLETRSWNSK